MRQCAVLSAPALAGGMGRDGARVRLGGVRPCGVRPWVCGRGCWCGRRGAQLEA